MEYVIERLAIHLVDKASQPRAVLSDVEVDMAAARQEVKDFLAEHISDIWNAREGNVTRSGIFLPDSPVKDCYEELMRDSSRFLIRTRELAQRLYDVSPPIASAGLLLVLLFGLETEMGQQRKFLGIFKMDPSDDYKVILESPVEAQLSIDVQEISKALPDPGENRVLKCAIITHPERPDFHVKLRDNQGTIDPAIYFSTFLGCTSKPSEKAQAKAVFRVIDEYATRYHASEAWEAGVPSLVGALEGKPQPLRADDVIDSIREVGLFRDFRESDFRQELGSSPAADLAVSSRSIERAKIAYDLPSGIVIRGPVAAMKSAVSIESVPGGVEFRIRSTADYKVSYE